MIPENEIVVKSENEPKDQLWILLSQEGIPDFCP